MKRIALTSGMMLAITMLSLWLWRAASPYPAVLSWDTFEHQTAVSHIRRGSGALLPSGLTDTFRFDGYTTLFHLGIAGIQTITAPDPLRFWWAAEGVLLASVIVLSYFVATAFHPNPWAGFFGALTGAMIFESQVAYTPFFFIPQTVSAIVGIPSLILAMKPEPNKYWAAIVSLLYLSILLHFAVGTYVLGMLLMVLYAKRLNPHRLNRAMAFFPALLLGAGSLLSLVPALKSINYGEAASFIPTIGQKLRYLTGWYGGSIILIPAGLLLAYRSSDKKQKILGTLAAVSLTTFLVPLPYTLKFMAAGRFPVHALMAIPLVYLIQRFRTSAARIAAAGIGTVMFAAILVSNLTAWKALLYHDGIASEISAEERQAADFLRNRYGTKTNAIIISDPATQYILEALSGINSQGGAYAAPATRTTAAALIGAPSGTTLIATAAGVRDALDTGQPDQVIFAASGRYFRWTDNPQSIQTIAHNIWRPEDLTLTDRSDILKFQQKTSLQPVFSNAAMTIYEIPVERATL